jgi:hypothetical protein
MFSGAGGYCWVLWLLTGVIHSHASCNTTLESGDVHLIAWTTTLEWNVPACSNVMTVEGDLYLHGSLFVNLANLPAIGTQTQFTILNAHMVHDEFDAIEILAADTNWVFQLEYRNQSVVLDAHYVTNANDESASSDSSDSFDWLQPWREGSEADRFYLVALIVCALFIIMAIVSVFLSWNFGDPTTRPWWRYFLMFAIVLLIVVLVIFYLVEPDVWAKFTVVKIVGAILFTFIAMQIYMDCCLTRSRAGPRDDGLVEEEWDVMIVS